MKTTPCFLFLVVLSISSLSQALPVKDHNHKDFDIDLYDPFFVAPASKYDWIFQMVEKLEKGMKKEKESKTEQKAKDEAVLNNVPGLDLPRPFAAFHPVVIGNRLKHLEAEILREIEQDKAQQELELEAMKVATKEHKPHKPWKDFDPMSFRIIGK